MECKRDWIGWIAPQSRPLALPRRRNLPRDQLFDRGSECRVARRRYHHGRSYKVIVNRCNQVAFWVRSEDVLRRLVFDDHLPRNKLPVANKTAGIRGEDRT